MAVTSSLNAIHISPRTPRTPHPNMGDEDDVELSLLSDAERLQSARESHSSPDSEPDTKRNISAKDKRGMVLLCVLCEYLIFPVLSFFNFWLDLLQGIPVCCPYLFSSKNLD